MLTVAMLVPMSVRAFDDGGWNEGGWAYLDSEDAFAYPEPPAPAKKEVVLCKNGVNHHGSPCDCAPVVLDACDFEDDGPMVCEHPLGDNEELLKDFKKYFEERPDFSEELPILRLPPECGPCTHKPSCPHVSCGCRSCRAGAPHARVCVPCDSYACYIVQHIHRDNCGICYLHDSVNTCHPCSKGCRMYCWTRANGFGKSAHESGCTGP